MKKHKFENKSEFVRHVLRYWIEKEQLNNRATEQQSNGALLRSASYGRASNGAMKQQSPPSLCELRKGRQRSKRTPPKADPPLAEK
ncbi:MAG: hypothetical protein WCT18_01635 [Patescibacteria group bacterium]